MIPQGYKHTELGIIPQEWEAKRVKEICKIDANSLATKTPAEYEFDYISLSDVEDEKLEIQTSHQIFKTAPSRARRILKKGDVVISTVRPNLKGFFMVKNDAKDLIASTGFAVLSPLACCDSTYLLSYFYSQAIDRQLHSLVVGSNYPAVNSKDVANIKIAVPPVEEQRKIAEILGVWDKAIELQARLVDKLELRKRALMQRLLTGRLRLPGFSDPWQKVKLGDISHIQTGKRNGEEQIQNGLYPFFVRSNNIARINTYSFDGEAILIPGEGDIGNIFHYIVGKFDYHQRVYKISNFAETICGKYVFYYMQQYFRYHALSFTVKATVDSLRLPTFECFNINIPDIIEQIKIVDVLETADKEIEIAKAKLAAYRTQKRGLMQQLLTGKKRVKL